MSKKMLINATLPEEERVAIVEDGLLTELDIEVAGREQTKGNIYKAEVIRVEAGLQAAFVDYGAARPGFLQIGDIHPALWPAARNGESGERRRPAINDILKRGQKLLVQVVKEERGTKGAALTTELSLAGRYMVLLAESNSRGISRKIEHEPTRRNIKKALEQLDLPENMGYIIRTAAIDQPPEELKRDFDYLLGIYHSIIDHAQKASAPALIYQESGLVLRSIRDYFTPEIDEVLIDDREVYQQAREFFLAVMPQYAPLVKLHQERRPIFARYQIEEQIAQLSSNTVSLPSGGSIVLDQTEALVAIDVNSGKMSGEQDVEATATRVNLEAAAEIGRQLRLRDLGGLIVIDFIDMRQRKNGREVEKALKLSLKNDKARVTLGRISTQFGLLEMSRQRIKPNLGATSTHSCPHCQGTGRVRSEESRAVALLRRIQAATAKGQIDLVNARVALDVASYLLNSKRADLHDLEQRYGLKITIQPEPGYLPDQMDIDCSKAPREAGEENTPQRALVDMDLSERSRPLEERPLPSESAIAPASEAANEDLPSDTTEGDTPVASASPASEDMTPARSSRRRSRGRGRRKKTANGTAATEATGTLQTDPASAAMEPSPDSTSPPADMAPTIPTTDGANEAAAVRTTAAEEDASGSKPAKRPTRRGGRRKKSTPTDKAVAPAEAISAKAADSPVPPPATPATPATPAAPATSTSAPVAGKQATATNLAETESVKKPTRRRTSRKAAPTDSPAAKPADAAATASVIPRPTADSNSESATEATAVETAESAKKPARRRTGRKPAASSMPATGPAGDSTVAVATTGSDSSEKKPARRRTSRKTTDSDTTTSAASSETTTAETTKKPVRRRRTSKTASSGAGPEDIV